MMILTLPYHLQLTNCQALGPAKTMLGLSWAGLSSCLVLKEGDIQFTDRLIQERYRRTVTSFCTGG